VSDEQRSPSDRVRLRRLPELASYDKETIYGILDATSICHVGIVVDGHPLVLPSLHVRIGDTLVLHGSQSSHLLRSMVEGPGVCVTVTLVDGLIVARSTFNSSVAYRSVVVFGSARMVSDEEERRSVLDALVEGLLPGRSSEVRASSESELRRTGIVVVDIEDASAKISAGPPEDDEEDVAGHAWAGVIPLVQKAGAPIPAPDGIVGDGLVEIPPSVRRYVDLR